MSSPRGRMLCIALNIAMLVWLTAPRGASAAPFKSPGLSDWSCADRPTDCAILYHVFTPSPPPPSGASSTLREDFWQAFIAAATVRLSATLSSVPIVLATNYQRDALTRAEKVLSEANWGTRGSSSVVDVANLFAGREDKDNCLKAFALLRERFALAARVEWPFTAYRIYAAETKYTLKAIAMNATLVADGGPAFALSGAGAAAKKKTASAVQPPFQRTLFIDTDTITLGDLIPALDALAAFDVALVGEYRSFSSGAQYLYMNLLHAPDKFSVYAYSGRKARKAPEYVTTAVYEQQFNTGLMAFRYSVNVLHLLRDWEAVHMADDVCRNDRVAWDQCSLPHALRRSSARVGVLPAEYNAREALGTGCEGPVYATMTDPSMVGESGNFSAAVVVHNFVKPAMREFLRRDLFPSADIRNALLGSP